jgi:hypothetical protein
MPPAAAAAADKKIVCGKLFASWCHFCKELKGPWKKVIAMMQRDKSMICISKEMALGDEKDEQKQQDMLLSLTQELQAKQNIAVQGGYPTIFKLDPFNNVVYFEGPRTVQGLYQFFTGKSLPHTVPHSSSVRKRRTGGSSWFKMMTMTQQKQKRRRTQRKF